MRKFTVIEKPLGIYIPTRHDPVLTDLHADNCDDGMIAEKMMFHPRTITSNRERLGLPPVTVQPGRGEHVMKAVAPLNRKSALDIAAETLPEFDPLTMTLDGVSKKLPELMRMVNRELKRQGFPQVDYNGDWLV